MSERATVGPRRPGFGRGIFIGRLFGIEFYLDYSWFLIAAVITYTWSMHASFPPSRMGARPFAAVYWVMGSTATFLFFVSLLLHELGHSLVSQKCGIPVPRITLLFIGGVAEISREPDDAKSELKIAIGGPAVSVGLAHDVPWRRAAFSSSRTSRPRALVCLWLSITNVMLVVFNMIPGYPLDGGRILRALIWQHTGKLHRATFITSRIGIGFSWLLIVGGAFLVLQREMAGLVWILIGFFLKSAADAGYANAVQRDVLAGVSVRDIMTKTPVCLPDTLPLNLAVDDYFLTNHHEALPVIAEDGEFRGLLRIEHMKDVPRERWPYMSTGDLVAEKETQLMKLEADHHRLARHAPPAQPRLRPPGRDRRRQDRRDDHAPRHPAFHQDPHRVGGVRSGGSAPAPGRAGVPPDSGRRWGGAVDGSANLQTAPGKAHLARSRLPPRRLLHRRCQTVCEQPRDFPLRRLHERAGKGRVAAQHLAQDVRLADALREEEDFARGVEQREGHGDALRRRLGADGGDDVADGFFERRRAGEERGGVAVFAQAEQDQIVHVARFAGARGDGGELRFVLRGGGFLGESRRACGRRCPAGIGRVEQRLRAPCGSCCRRGRAGRSARRQK